MSKTFGTPLQPALRPPEPTLVRQLRPRLDDIVFCSKLQSLHPSGSTSLIIKQPAVDLFCFRNCSVVGPQGYIFLNKRTPLSQGGMDPEKMMRPLPQMSSRQKNPLFYLAENSVSRAHAVMEHLSRYQIAKEFLPKNTKIIVQKVNLNGIPIIRMLLGPNSLVKRLHSAQFNRPNCILFH